MKVRVERLCAIQCKLRMMGISISGFSYISRDNKSVIHNTLEPESRLKKKCSAIAYHVVHESVAMRQSPTGHVRSEENPTNILTKLVTGQK